MRENITGAKESISVMSIDIVRRMWDELSDRLQHGVCMRCDSKGPCFHIGCSTRSCRKLHLLCEFCFIDGAVNGVISPNYQFEKEDEEETKVLLEGLLFGGEEE